jgi:2,7-dihydroxy-5-methyl-1-naphthoate 7-O-methyltransferase
MLAEEQPRFAFEGGDRRPPPSDEPVWSILAANLHPIAVAAAVELGLLDAIGEGSDVGQLAAAVGVAPRVATTLIEHLLSLRLLEEDADEHLTVSAWGKAHLRPSGGQFRDLFEACKDDPRYRGLLRVARADRPPAASDHYANAKLEASVRGTYAETAAIALAGSLDLRGRRHLLDVGGGHGTILAAVLEPWPQLTATLLDLPPVAPLATNALRERGMESRVRVVAGDFQKGLPPGEPPDTVLLSQILVDLGSAERARLLENCRDRLQAGGELIVHEMLASPRASRSLLAAMNTELLLWSAGHHMTEAQLRDTLLEAGFEQPTTSATWGLWSVTTAIAR